MGTSFAGPIFLQSGVPRPQRALFSVGMNVSRPETLVLSMATQLVNLNLVKI